MQEMKKKEKMGTQNMNEKKGEQGTLVNNIEQPFTIGEICKKVKLNLKNSKMKCFWTFQLPKMKQNK
jgi:hypothetical protein